ncbi:PTS sugar transporter subunit IIA [Lactobacillus amylovorus]|uniref:PTS sugar transporter subunit IIA n=1 Tax=Lactobacillus amylovorus TaxID=1604 RepID=UPI002FDB9623
MSRTLINFFDSDNFVRSTNLNDINQIFDTVSYNFERQGVVQSDFKKRLYQREKMSSTAFGRIAIPYSLDMSAQKSKGFIIINSHGIKWSDNNEVCLVIDPNNKQLFREVFDELSDVVTDINNVTELIKCKNYSEFIVKLVELL